MTRTTSSPLAYGIDFGTSNSLVSVAWPGQVEVLDLGSRRVPENLPSLIYLSKDGNRDAGDEALAQYLVGGGRDSRLLVGIKSDLSDTMLSYTESWNLKFSLPELVAIVLKKLKTKADRIVGTPVDRVVLGHPVAFVGTEGEDFEERQRCALERLIEAAQLAGFRQIETLEEPAAAVQDEVISEGTIVSLDFGGGTFDVAVVRFTHDSGDVLALEGAEVGGERFDQLLFEAKIAPLLNAHRLPAWVRSELRSSLGLRRLLGAPQMPQILSKLKMQGVDVSRLERLLYGGYGYAFYEAIEEAKIQLSTRSEASISFQRPGFDMRTTVSRAEFEELIAADIHLLRETIEAALHSAGIRASQVQAVFRTGGSSSIPAFVRMVGDIFGPAKIQKRPPFTTVVHGLGCFAQQVFV